MKFRATLLPDPEGVGTYVAVPPHVADSLGLKGRPKIQAVIAGHPYRGSLMPTREGTYCLGVLKAIQQAAGVKRGDEITVELAIDSAPRVIQPPADLAKALGRDMKAAAAWDKLSYTSKREIAMGLDDAKKPETRARRLAAAMARLRG
ncbi:MAG TPA: YdeI/OmpD-associated family protein [Candidatus Limnocylindrales bacterium]|nr:YdeI/OmpD-associated family protein [Candidatus Limnocylindrales bacterium]